jgi:O-antigen ligase
MLGYLLFVFGLFFCCTFFGKFGENRDGSRFRNSLIVFLFLGMIAWLFYVSDSKTPLLCFLAGVLVLIGSGFATVRKHWDGHVVIAVLVFAALQLTLDVGGILVASAGRDTTLTGRTDLWQSVIELSESPWVGSGFASFWLGERLERLWTLWAFRPVQAHNGYLETYLNLGWAGVICLTGLVFSGYRGLRKKLEISSLTGEHGTLERDFARFRMAFFVCFLIYNITEAAFQALNILFIVFLLAVMESPRRQFMGEDVGCEGISIANGPKLERTSTLSLAFVRAPRPVGHGDGAAGKGQLRPRAFF